MMPLSIDKSSLTVGIFTGLSVGILLGWVLRKKLRVPVTNLGSAIIQESFNEFGPCECKLVLVVRNDLKMGKGKVAAQCSHASVIAYRQLQKKDPDTLRMWELSGQRKVVVKIDNESLMSELAAKARSEGLLTSLVCDAGRTQIAAGSKTVLGVGPGPENLVDKVTGHLKLY
ncbi:peptidyl-tRNA hydrolase 2, mitochondrial-like [Centruroides sculpturatus]|uniref:peptidyl-tRNA hydrolase 2, mitochondrial-like n=1 Tax=Centruroides sculpturatus TaxID=218467 RepID=UPI000C6DE3CC|nr:peptidyl-tRNA hydrolase 2, mitochondrial-like [Centruroides sculpturatus]XP_023233040.1 peptidyl-tRNA hydrolase 2, mitochondrial-like [Centruroides sculpturatus]